DCRMSFRKVRPGRNSCAFALALSANTADKLGTSVRKILPVGGASGKNHWAKSDCRTSASTIRVLRPSCANEMAQFMAQNVLPSPGWALVNNNVRREFACWINRRDDR